MLRQGNSRNQRSKGFRVKHILQICLLLAISIWLLYQLKHSYDKKTALEARNNAKIFNKVADTGPDLFKLGRKGLLPGIEETDPANETHNKEDESEVVEEEEEPETKQETEEEHGRGAGDDDVIDEIDEQDQERGDEEAELRDEEDKVVHDEGVGLLEEQELEGREGDSQEAREENYKRDDASSAVRHDTRAAESELGNGDQRSETVDDPKEKSEMSTFETVDGSNGNASTADLGENQTSQNGTDAEKSEPEVGASMFSGSNSTGLEHELQTNSTESAESNNQMELQANSTANVSETTVETQSNSTEVDVVANGNVGAIGLDSVQDRNATVDTATHGDDKPDLLLDAVTAEQTEMANRSENGDAARGETDDSSAVTAEEREVRADLSNLPSIQNKAKNEENVAAE